MAVNQQPQAQQGTDKLGAMHHYVPQGYLKRFATPDKPEQIVAYEADREPYKTNVHNVAGQRDFYTYSKVESGEKDAALEDALADMDAAGANMLRILDDMPDGYVELPEEQKGDLLAYVAFQHTRNLQERKVWATMYEQSTEMFMQVAASNEGTYHKNAQEALGDKYDMDIVERTRQAFLDGKAGITFDPLDQYFIGTALEMSRTLYEMLFTMKKMVLVSKTDDADMFVTSDNPVTHYLTDEQKAKRPAFYGVGYVDAVFQLPISPTRCLLLINDDMIMETFQYDQDAVNRINFYTYHFADRWVFSNVVSDTIKTEFNKFKRREPLTSVSSPFDRARKASEANKD
ncbi:DUF4238 domain-containing protein [Candidatus Saccharibacteria bacterium]|nr:DUF4238 domain-containing protein [Candidatus Saccharibacteria bacterium]